MTLLQASLCFSRNIHTRALIVLIFLSVPPVETLAQYSDSLTLKENEWIEKMTNYLNAKLAITNDLEAFTVDTDGFSPELFPNTSTTLKASFNYRFLSINLKHAPNFLPGNHDNSKKGKTKNFGLSFGFIHPHWFTTVGYAKNKGYYVHNSDEISDTWQEGDPYLQVPGLKVNSFEGLTGYSFNEKFSVRSLTTQTERQLKSAGTFAPIFGYRLYYVNNLSDDSGQKTRNFEFELGAGYHYTFVIKKSFYASLALTPAVGYIFTKLTTRGQFSSPDEIVTNSKAPIARLDGRGAFGYNGEKFFAGAHVELRGSSYKQESTTAINTDTRVFYQVFAGYRFAAPKSLKKMLDKVPLK